MIPDTCSKYPNKSQIHRVYQRYVMISKLIESEFKDNGMQVYT